MGRNEIKIRRNNMTEGHIARHRNYGLLMKRHRRDLRIRKLTIVLIYLLIVVAVTVLYIVVKREEQHRKGVPLHPSTAMEIMSNEKHDQPDPIALHGIRAEQLPPSAAILLSDFC